MNYNQIKKLIICLTLCFAAVNIAPSQNTGPSAPEAMQFEPVDATDMVNLNTGDLSYVLPLLDIPTPSGSYPIAINYHGGVAMEQEASWVGLGWNINPGAINRGVNDVPDDASGMGITNIFYDSGGSKEYTTIGVYDPYHGIGLSYTYGDYRGLGGTIGYKKIISASYDPVNGVSFGVSGGGISGKVGENGFSLGVGTNHGNFSYTYRNGESSINYSSSVLVLQNRKGDRSLASASVGFNLSSGNLYRSGPINVGIGKGVDNMQNINLHTSLDYSNLDLIVYNYTNVKQKWNYYSKESYRKYGIFYLEDGKVDYIENYWDGMQRKYVGLDTYSVPYNTANYDEENAYESETNCLFFPAYDNYIVSGQGIGGSISPHIFENGVLVDNSKTLLNYFGTTNPKYELLYHFQPGDPNSTINYTNDVFDKTYKDIYFSFNDEFCSYLSLSNENWTYDGGNAGLGLWSYSNSGGIVDHEYNGNSNYNSNNHRNASGRHIEWIPNEEIVNGIELRERDYLAPACINDEDRDNDDSGNDGKWKYFTKRGIGSIIITDNDGVTYHYSLPVYNYGEYYKDRLKGDNSAFSYGKSSGMYAYTWLLTAITGPDFIDNPDPNTGEYCTLGEEDYGYWVSFEYGKWTDSYLWKTPFDGYKEYSIEGKVHERIKWGIKQIYYLNYIKSKTHTACFIKDVRDDGLGYNEGSSLSSGWMVAERDHYYFWPIFPSSTPEREFFGYACGTNTEIWGNGISCDELQEIFTFDVQTQNRTLYLKEIVLIDNNQISSTMNSVDLIDNEVDVVGINVFHQKKYTGNVSVAQCWYEGATWVCPAWGVCDFDICNTLADNDYYAHFQDNVLDINDNVSNIKSNAINRIILDYDYHLCPGTPNSIAVKENAVYEDFGKLTLNSIRSIGRNSLEVMPPYTFDYYDEIEGVPNNFDLERMDDWGYDKGYTEYLHHSKPSHIWSLKEIVNPLGSRITIEYDNDTYSTEAVYGANKFTPIKAEIVSTLISETIDPIPVEVKLSFPTNSYYDVSKVSPSDVFDMVLRWQCKYTREDPVTGEITEHYKKWDKELTLSPHNIDITNNTMYFDFGEYGMFTDFKELLEVTKLDFEFLSPLPTSDNTCRKGGGLCTKNIKVYDGSKLLSTTEYDYFKDGKSTGITSFAPRDIDEWHPYIPYINELPYPGVTYGQVKVTNYGEDNSYHGYTVYNFNNLDVATNYRDYTDFTMGDDFLVETDMSYLQGNSSNWVQNPDNSKEYYKVHQRNSVIHDNFSTLGRLESMSEYNSFDELIHKEIYNYFGETGAPILPQGIKKETFKYRKMHRDWAAENKTYSAWFLNSSSRVEKSNALASTDIYANGVKQRIEYNQYDFNTGNLIATKFWDSDGDEYLTKTIPAYWKYDGMGSKANNLANANMLTQETATYTYLNNNDVYDVVSANIQTWKNDWTYRDWKDNKYQFVPAIDLAWRKHEEWYWAGDLKENGAYDWVNNNGIYDKDYDWNNSSNNNNNGWKRASGIKQYNHYSVPLEKVDFNENYGAIQMGYDDSYILSTATNSRYTEYAFSGAEDLNDFNDYFGSSEVQKLDGVVNTNLQYVHTGEKSLKLNTGSNQYTFRKRINISDGASLDKEYLAQVWVHEINALGNAFVEYQYFAGTTSVDYKRVYVTAETQKYGNWYLLTLDIPRRPASSGADVLQVSCVSDGSNEVYLDDFRVLPFKAAMAAYVYDEPTGLVTAIFNDKHFATKYEYDHGGRLVAIYSETPNGFIKTNEYKHNYSKMATEIGPLWVHSYYDENVWGKVNFEVVGQGTTWPDCTFEWAFGDGLVEVTDTRTVTHNYSEVGEFNLTVNIKYKGVRVTSADELVTIAPIITYTTTALSTTQCQDVTLELTAEPAEGLNYQWYRKYGSSGIYEAIPNATSNSVVTQFGEWGTWFAYCDISKNGAHFLSDEYIIGVSKDLAYNSVPVTNQYQIENQNYTAEWVFEADLAHIAQCNYMISRTLWKVVNKEEVLLDKTEELLSGYKTWTYHFDPEHHTPGMYIVKVYWKPECSENYDLPPVEYNYNYYHPY